MIDGTRTLDTYNDFSLSVPEEKQKFSKGKRDWGNLHAH